MSEAPGHEISSLNSRGRIRLFDEFFLDLDRGEVTRAGAPVHLRPQTYEVLKFLAENPGRLISKDKLIEEVWKGRAVTDGSLGKCIEELRDALGPRAKKFIRTVRGRGYVLDVEPPRKIVSSDQIDVFKVTVEQEETSADLRTHWSRTRIGIVVVALLAVGVAVVAGAFLMSRRFSKTNAAIVVPFREMEISRVTSSGAVSHASVSPDGQYVAYVIKGSEGDSLWVRHLNAPSNVRVAGPEVTEYISVNFAPDSNFVYYVTLDRDKGESTMYRVRTLGGPAEAVTDDVYPIDFSPDGRQMAFFRNDRSQTYLIVADAVGQHQRVVASRSLPEAFRAEWNAPAWAPDGKAIACSVRLKNQHGNYETIVIVNPADGSQKPLTSVRWSNVGQPVWLPDGSGLLMTGSDGPNSPLQIWHLGLKDGVATRITHDLNNYYDLSITADGKRLEAVQIHSLSSIWVTLESDLNNARQIASEVGSVEVLAWTPDGRLVYRSGAGGSGDDVWIMNADGSNAKQLTTSARVSRGLTVTPEGRHIIFVSDRAGHSNLWSVDADGGNLRQLTSGEGEFYPQSTPDGQWIVYQNSELEPTVWKIPTAGGQPVQLATTRAARPSVSPDGQMVAYYYLDPELERSRWGIGIVPVGGGSRLTRFDFPPTVVDRYVRWSPDGRSVAFVNSPGGRSDIWLQPLDGGPQKQLTNFQAERIVAFAWSPDGRSLAFIRNVQTSDVVLIESVSSK